VDEVGGTVDGTGWAVGSPPVETRPRSTPGKGVDAA
jgi:hypothetical protein